MSVDFRQRKKKSVLFLPAALLKDFIKVINDRVWMKTPAEGGKQGSMQELWKLTQPCIHFKMIASPPK